MNNSSSFINVFVSTDKNNTLALQYDNDICVGELIRNCCVNLGLQDFDTIDGFTINIDVLIKIDDAYVRFNYQPHKTLKEILVTFDIQAINLLITPNNN